MTKTYRQRNWMTSPVTRCRRGFVLVEILIVIAIVALLLFTIVPRIKNKFSLSIRAGMRQMTAAIKEAYDLSALTGNVNRIVYDLEKNEYWVETGPADVLLDTEESKEREQRRKEIAGAEYKPKESKFDINTLVTEKKVSLPDGVSFSAVYTQEQKDPIREGKAYTHIFPNGLTEQTVIHLIDINKHKYTIIVSPLIGKSEIINEFVDPDDIFK